MLSHVLAPQFALLKSLSHISPACDMHVTVQVLMYMLSELALQTNRATNMAIWANINTGCWQTAACGPMLGMC